MLTWTSSNDVYRCISVANWIPRDDAASYTPLYVSYVPECCDCLWLNHRYLTSLLHTQPLDINTYKRAFQRCLPLHKRADGSVPAADWKPSDNETWWSRPYVSFVRERSYIPECCDCLRLNIHHRRLPLHIQQFGNAHRCGFQRCLALQEQADNTVSVANWNPPEDELWWLRFYVPFIQGVSYVPKWCDCFRARQRYRSLPLHLQPLSECSQVCLSTMSTIVCTN